MFSTCMKAKTSHTRLNTAAAAAETEIQIHMDEANMVMDIATSDN